MALTLPTDVSPLDSIQRLAAFNGDMLSREHDGELQRLVREAADCAGWPIALVSLVGLRVQFFRAHVGLPPDLAAACATDRDASFCQFVAASGKPLEVNNATQEPALPLGLIQRYGVTAYYGVPLFVGGQPVGSFCVIDLKPGHLTPGQKACITALAASAAARLAVLASQYAPVDGEEDASVVGSWIALHEASALQSLAARFASGGMTLDEFKRGVGALAGLAGSLEG